MKDQVHADDYGGMQRPELLAVAKSKNVTIETGASDDDIRAAIRAADAAAADTGHKP